MSVALRSSTFALLTFVYVTLVGMDATYAADKAKPRIDSGTTQEAHLLINHRRDIDEQAKKLTVRGSEGRSTFSALSAICDSSCKVDANRCRLQVWRADLHLDDIANERSPYQGSFEIPALDQERAGGERPAPSTKKCDTAEASCLKKCACLRSLE